MTKPISSFLSFCRLLLLLCLVVCDAMPVLAAGSIIQHLLGFKGPLPFELETGYIGVGEGEEVQLFYYFAKSQSSHPSMDPLMIWIGGGPGCSSLSALVFGIGPIAFEASQEFNNDLPPLVLNPSSWTQVANIIFLDLPVGTRFSYGTTRKAHQVTDLESRDQAYEFLRKFLADHPEYRTREFYLAGDSFSGLIVPLIAQAISDGTNRYSSITPFLISNSPILMNNCARVAIYSNLFSWHCRNENGVNPSVNLKGYLLGNPVTRSPAESTFVVPFAHRMGLISDELLKAVQSNCKGEEYFGAAKPGTPCYSNMEEFSKTVEKINYQNILEPYCPYYSSMVDSNYNGNTIERSRHPTFRFRCDRYLWLEYWCNLDIVREALHTRKGTNAHWVGCSTTLEYDATVRNSVPYHAYLSSKGYRLLVYSGDHDMCVPYTATEFWIKSLNFSIVGEWRPWNYEGQVAGFTRSYENSMTFATVKSGGHSAPEYKPKECNAMFRRWINQEHL